MLRKALVLGAMMTASLAMGAGMRAEELGCEYLTNPLGIDSPSPRLSWILAAEGRNKKQTAFRIVVATTRELLAKGKGDLWDTGKRTSDETNQIEYRGKALKSNEKCFWKVKVWDEKNKPSEWSKAGFWSMGLLKPSDWKAKWIGRKPEDGKSDPWLRKTFELPAKPTTATIHVASIGYHELWVNGQKVTDTVLEPCVSDHTSRARYVTYDITKNLVKGRNVVGLWLGTSWSIFPPYKSDDKPQLPVVIAQGAIQCGDKQTQILTDSTWRTHDSPSQLIGSWQFGDFGGEFYDANKELPNWCGKGLDEKDWADAVEYTPKVKLSAQTVEPTRLSSELKPLEIEKKGDGVYRIDMGKVFSGFLEAHLVGKPGSRVELEWSEREGQPITYGMRSAVILGPSGKHTFRNRFNYGVGRWVTVRGVTEPPTDVKGWLVRTDYKPAATFECSDKALTDLYEATLWTFQNLSLGGYVVDCPHRERLGYGGDAHATTEMALNSFQLGAFYTKWAQDWRDVQGWEPMTNEHTGSGNLPYTAPTHTGGGGPGWSGYCVTLPWELYRYYGDKRVLKEGFATIERWLTFLDQHSKADQLQRIGGDWCFLGDWVWPGAIQVGNVGDQPETVFFNQCYWVYNLTTAAKIAAVLGKPEQAAKWNKRADEVRLATHAKYFNTADNSYVNGDQAYLAFALLVGIPPEDKKPLVWKRLEHEIRDVRKDHIWAGIGGGAFLYKLLIENNRADLACLMAQQKDYPGWLNMLNQGATTIWEQWDGENSRCHSSYLYVGNLFMQGIAGIRPDPAGPGFKRILIRPSIVGGLTWARALLETPRGVLVSQWKLTGGKFELGINVPPNTTATVFVPAKDQASVIADSAKFLRIEDGCVVYEVGSGHWHFEAAR